MTFSRVNSKSIIGKALTFHLFLEWQPGLFVYYFLSEGGDGGVGRRERSKETSELEVDPPIVRRVGEQVSWRVSKL